MTEKLWLGHVDDIADGQAKGFDLNHSGSDTFFIIRQGTELFAYVDICPHYNDTSLPWKRHHYLDSASNYIVCAAHGALFEIGNGNCVQGPCKGQKLRQIPLEVSSKQEVWISLTTVKEFNL